MRYDAVLLDNDGVLTEPTDLDVLGDAIRRAFRDHGIEDPPEEHVRDLVGVTPDGLTRICGIHGIERPDSFWAARDRYASRAQRELVRNGGKALYDDVAAIGGIDVPRGVVSNNQHRTIECIIDHYGLDWAETWYGRAPTVEDIARKKPGAYYVERAIDDLDAENPLLVGDSNADLGAAANAGIDAAYLRRSHRAAYALEYEPAYELSNLHELVDIVAGDG